jgi:putative transposase
LVNPNILGNIAKFFIPPDAMPGRSTDFLAGQYYHLYNRGHNRQNIFFERENYSFFLRQVRHYLTTQGIDIVAYCLMPNHYHFLVHLQRDHILSMAMQALSVSYTKAINRRYARSGALFQGRFQAIEVDSAGYVVALSRYIHLNPVKAGLVLTPEAWEFSSYQEYAGTRPGTLPKMETILKQVGSQKAYRSFMAQDATVMEPLLRVLCFDE